MAKVLRPILQIAAIAVNFIPGLGQLASFAITAALTVGATLLSTPARQRRAAAAATLQLGEQPRQAVLGRAAVAGSLVDAFNYGGKYQTDWEVLVIALADHRCDALEGFFVDDTYVAFVADGNVAGFNNQLQVFWRDGRWEQEVPSILTTNGPGWSANDRGRGVAWVVVAYKGDAPDAKNPVWPSGRPRFRWVVRGLRCYQPRRDSTVGGSGGHRRDNPATWEWTENPIDIRHNWARGIYAGDRVAEPGMLLIGRGLSAIEAPPANVFARANLCDEQVGGQARYRIGGVVAASESFIEVESDLAAAVAGVISQPQGAVEVDPGEAKAPIAHFTDADLIVGTQVRSSEFLSDSSDEWVNTVVARYIEPGQRWNQQSAPVRREIADVIADGAPREAQVTLDFVNSGAPAQRIAEIVRRQGRLWRRAQVTLPPRFAFIEEGDWVTWQSDRHFGGATFTFRVEAWASDQGWRHQLTLRQISASVYSDTAPLSDGAIASNQLPPPEIAAPGAGAWTLSAVAVDSGDLRVPTLRIEGAVDDLAARAVVFEYVQQTGAPDDQTAWSFGANARPDITRLDIPAVGGGVFYAAVSYIVDGVIGPRRVLGPVTAPKLAYSDGTPVDELKPGSPGATRNVPQGEYDNDTLYIRGDQLSLNGSYYELTVDESIGNPPPDAARWKLVFVGGGGVGQDGITIELTNHAHVVPVLADGSGGDFSTGGGTMRLRRGTMVLAPVFSVAARTPGTNWISIDPVTGVYTPTDPGVDLATATLRAAFSGVNYDQTYTLSRNRRGAAGAPGTTGTSVAEFNVYRRSATEPAAPSGGSFDFGTATLTPPVGWSSTLPEGPDPAYVSRGVAITALAGGIDTPEWSDAVRFVQDGDAVDIIFRRSADQPATPDPSSGIPAGWFPDGGQVPAGPDPMWASVGTRPSPLADWVWQVPFRPKGDDGLNNAVIQLFLRAPESPAPARPTSTAMVYTFADGSIINAAPWSRTPPAANGNPLWLIQRSAASADATVTITGASFSAPAIIMRDGVSAPANDITNDNHTVTALADGTGYSLVGAGGQMQVFVGSQDVTSLVGAAGGLSIVGGTNVGGNVWQRTQNGLTMTLQPNGIYTPSGANWTTDLEIFTLRSVNAGVTIDQTYKISKARGGLNGINARAVRLLPTRNQIRLNALGQPSPANQDNVFTIARQNISAAAVWELFNIDGTPQSAAFLSGSGDTRTLTAINFNSARGSTPGVRIRVSVTEGGVTASDQESIIAVQDGADANSLKLISTHENFSLVTSTGLYVPQTTTITAIRPTLTGTVTWNLKAEGSETLIPFTDFGTINPGGDSVSFGQTNFADFLAAYGGRTIRVRATVAGVSDESLLSQITDSSLEPVGASFIRTRNGDSGTGGWTNASVSTSVPSSVTRPGARSLNLLVNTRERRALDRTIRAGDRFRLRYWINTAATDPSNGSIFFCLRDEAANPLTNSGIWTGLATHPAGVGWTFFDGVITYNGSTISGEWLPAWNGTLGASSTFLLFDADFEYVPVSGALADLNAVNLAGPNVTGQLQPDNAALALRNDSIGIVGGALGGIGTGAGTLVANSAITVLANGSLGGIGTPGIVVQNSAITIQSGALQGIGTGAGTPVDNSAITIQSGQLQGIGTGAGTPVDNNALVPSINNAATTAAWTGVSSRPAELIDGRIPAAIVTNGNIATNRVTTGAIVANAVSTRPTIYAGSSLTLTTSMQLFLDMTLPTTTNNEPQLFTISLDVTDANGVDGGSSVIFVSVRASDPFDPDGSFISWVSDKAVAVIYDEGGASGWRMTLSFSHTPVTSFRRYRVFVRQGDNSGSIATTASFIHSQALVR